MQKNNNAQEHDNGGASIQFDPGHIQYTASSIGASVNNETKRHKLNQNYFPFPVRSVIHRRQSLQDVLKVSPEEVVFNSMCESPLHKQYGLKYADPNGLEPCGPFETKHNAPNGVECIQKEFVTFRDQMQNLNAQIQGKLLELQTRNPNATQRRREIDIVNSIEAVTTYIPPLSHKDSESMEEMELIERKGSSELDYVESYDDIREQKVKPEQHIQIDPDNVADITHLDRCCLPNPLSVLRRLWVPGARSKPTNISKPCVEQENDRFELSDTNSAMLIDSKIHEYALLEDMNRKILLKPTRNKLKREMDIAALKEEFLNLYYKVDSGTNDLKSNIDIARTPTQSKVDTGNAYGQRTNIVCTEVDRSAVSSPMLVDIKIREDEVLSRKKLLKPTSNRLQREMQIAMMMDEFTKSYEEDNKLKSAIETCAHGDATVSKVKTNATTTKAVNDTNKFATKAVVGTKKSATNGKTTQKPEPANILASCNELPPPIDDNGETKVSVQPNFIKKRKRVMPKVYIWDNIKSKVDHGKSNLQSTIDTTGTSAEVDAGNGHSVSKVKVEAKVLSSKRKAGKKRVRSKIYSGRNATQSKVDTGKNDAKSKIDTGRSALRLPKIDSQPDVENHPTNHRQLLRQPRRRTEKKTIKSKIDTGLRKPATSKINTGLKIMPKRNDQMRCVRFEDVEEMVDSRSGEMSPMQDNFQFINDEDESLDRQAKERLRRNRNTEPQFNSRSPSPPTPNSTDSPSPKVDNRNIQQDNIKVDKDDRVTGNSEANTKSRQKQKSELKFNARPHPPPPPNSPADPLPSSSTKDTNPENEVQRCRNSQNTNLSDNEKTTLGDRLGKTIEEYNDKVQTTNKVRKEEKVDKNHIVIHTNVTEKDRLSTPVNDNHKEDEDQTSTPDETDTKTCKYMNEKADQPIQQLQKPKAEMLWISMSPSPPQTHCEATSTRKRRCVKSENIKNVSLTKPQSPMKPVEVNVWNTIDPGGNGPAPVDITETQVRDNNLDLTSTEEEININENIQENHQPTQPLLKPKAEMVWISLSPSPPQKPCWSYGKRKLPNIKPKNNLNDVAKVHALTELIEDHEKDNIIPINERGINVISETLVRDGQDQTPSPEQMDIDKDVIEKCGPPIQSKSKAERLRIALSPSPPQTPCWSYGKRKLPSIKPKNNLNGEPKAHVIKESDEDCEQEDNDIPKKAPAPNDISETPVRDCKDLTPPQDEIDINKNVKETGGEPTEPTQTPKAEMLWISLSPSPPRTLCLTPTTTKRRCKQPEDSMNTVSKPLATSETGEETNNSTITNELNHADTDTEDIDTTSPPEEKAGEVLWISLSPTPPRTPPPRFRRSSRQNSAKVTGQRA